MSRKAGGSTRMLRVYIPNDKNGELEERWEVPMPAVAPERSTRVSEILHDLKGRLLAIGSRTPPHLRGNFTVALFTSTSRALPELGRTRRMQEDEPYVAELQRGFEHVFAILRPAVGTALLRPLAASAVKADEFLDRWKRYADNVYFVLVFETNVPNILFLFPGSKRSQCLDVLNSKTDPPGYVLALTPLLPSTSTSTSNAPSETVLLLREAYAVGLETVIVCAPQEIGVVFGRGSGSSVVPGSSTCSFPAVFPVIPELPMLLALGAEGVNKAGNLKQRGSFLMLSQSSIDSGALLNALFVRLVRENIEDGVAAAFEKIARLKLIWLCKWLWLKPVPTSLATEAAILGKSLFNDSTDMLQLLRSAASVAYQSGGAVHFSDGQVFKKREGSRLNKLELALLQVLHDMAKTGRCLEVLITMHGQLDVGEATITAPEGICVQLIRAAPAGFICLRPLEMPTQHRLEYFQELRDRGKAGLQTFAYKNQMSLLDGFTGEPSELARYKGFLDHQVTKGEHCALKLCVWGQRFFNKVYVPGDFCAITLIDLPVLKDLDLFSVAMACGYAAFNPARGQITMHRGLLFNFFKALGTTSVTFHDESCAVTNAATEEAQAAYLLENQFAMGGKQTNKRQG